MATGTKRTGAPRVPAPQTLVLSGALGLVGDFSYLAIVQRIEPLLTPQTPPAPQPA